MERIDVLEQGSCSFIDIPTYSCCYIALTIVR